MEAAGATVKTLEFHRIYDTYNGQQFVLKGGAYAALAASLTAKARYLLEVQAWLLMGKDALASDYLHVLKYQRTAQENGDKALEDVGLLLMPPAAFARPCALRAARVSTMKNVDYVVADPVDSDPSPFEN